MKKTMLFLLAAMLGSVAQADTARMNAMREAFARMDREDFQDGIEKANDCTQHRDFSCAEKQLADVEELIESSADELLFTMATRNLQAEKQQVAEEKRLAKEAEDRRRREEAARIAAEEREERERQRQEDAETHAAIMEAFASAKQSIERSGAETAALMARNQAVMNEYHASVRREQQQANADRAYQAQREREERAAQQNYDRRRAAASAQLATALKDSSTQRQREASISAYQQAQAATAALRTSPASLSGGVTMAAPGLGSNTAGPTTATGFGNTSDRTATSARGVEYIASPEGVVICELEAGGRFSCTTPIGTTISGGPNQVTGWRTPAEAVAYVGGCRTPRRISWRSGYEVFGCGTGITGSSNYQDVADMLGVTVPGRNTYWCKPLEVGCTRTSKP